METQTTPLNNSESFTMTPNLLKEKCGVETPDQHQEVTGKTMNETPYKTKSELNDSESLQSQQSSIVSHKTQNDNIDDKPPKNTKFLALNSISNFNADLDQVLSFPKQSGSESTKSESRSNSFKNLQYDIKPRYLNTVFKLFESDEENSLSIDSKSQSNGEDKEKEDGQDLIVATPEDQEKTLENKNTEISMFFTFKPAVLNQTQNMDEFSDSDE